MPAALARNKRFLSSDTTELQCPICGKTVLCVRPGNPVQPQCPDCKTVLWCHQRIEDSKIFLDALPGVVPQIADMQAVAQSPHLPRPLKTVIVNLRDLETLNSSFVAGLLVMHRLVHAAGGQLLLYDLQPHVRSILRRFNLHTVLQIVNHEEDATEPAQPDA